VLPAAGLALAAPHAALPVLADLAPAAIPGTSLFSPFLQFMGHFLTRPYQRNMNSIKTFLYTLTHSCQKQPPQ
jgi:hypothetical protein